MTLVNERADLQATNATTRLSAETAVRNSVISELENVTPRRSQFQPGDEIPEHSFVYRWAKKYTFNDFGTYAKHFEVSNYHAPDQGANPAPKVATGLPIVTK